MERRRIGEIVEEDKGKKRGGKKERIEQKRRRV
jgi:hypothetical protein